MQTIKPQKTFIAGRSAAVNTARSNGVVVRCNQQEDVIKAATKKAAVAAAALSIVLAAPMMAEAKIVYSNVAKKQAYEAEVLPNLSKLPSLKSSPGGIYTKKTEMSAFKMTEGGAVKTTIVSPDGVPTPDPAKPAAVNAPSAPSVMAAPPVSEPGAAPAKKAAAPEAAAAKAAAAKAPAPSARSTPAPAAASSSSSSSSDGPPTAVIGVGAAVAIAAVAAVTSNNGEGEEGAATTTMANAGTTGGSSDVLPNVVEARAWIAAWKAKSGKK